MSNLCFSCDHLGLQHLMYLGPCSGDCLDPDTGEFYRCVCPRFEQDSDD